MYNILSPEILYINSNSVRWTIYAGLMEDTLI